MYSCAHGALPAPVSLQADAYANTHFPDVVSDVDSIYLNVRCPTTAATTACAAPMHAPRPFPRPQPTEKESLAPYQDAFKGGVSSLEHGQGVLQGAESVRARGSAAVWLARCHWPRLAPCLTVQGFKNGVKSVEAASTHLAGEDAPLLLPSDEARSSESRRYPCSPLSSLPIARPQDPRRGAQGLHARRWHLWQVHHVRGHARVRWRCHLHGPRHAPPR